MGDRSVMLCFDSIPPDQFTLLATLLGILLANDLDVNEQNSLGNFIVSIGQSMLTLASQAENIKSQHENRDVRHQLDQLSSQLDSIKKQLKN